MCVCVCVCVCVVGSGKTDSDQQFETSNSTSHPYVLSQYILVSLSIRCSTVAVTVLFYSLTMSYLYHPTILLY